MKKFILLLGVLLSLFFGCASDSENDLIDQTPPPDITTYTADAKSILDNNCLNCHKSPPENGAPMSLTTFTDAKNAVENRGLIGRINSVSNPMPPSGLMSQTNRNIIQKWLDDGLLESE